VSEFKRSVDAVVREMRGSARLPGVARIFVPGEQSHMKMRDRTANGVPMPAALRKSLNEMATGLGVAPLD
jgi:LDH2 family malate/lactate/ureidoglycolate dehydrogenase